MKEIWKNINGYNGKYKISNLGRVKNSKGIIMKQSKNPRGYPTIQFHINSKPKTISVHRLVAEAYILNPENKPQVNHIDGNKSNNIVENLEWCTNLENKHHAMISGLCEKTKGKNHPKARGVIQYTKDGKFIKEWQCIKDAVKSLNKKSTAYIVACCQNRTNIKNGKPYQCKTAFGFKWKYADEKGEKDG